MSLQSAEGKKWLELGQRVGIIRLIGREIAERQNL